MHASTEEVLVRMQNKRDMSIIGAGKSVRLFDNDIVGVLFVLC